MQSFWDAITPTRDSKPDAAWSWLPALLGARWSTPPLTLVPLGDGAARATAMRSSRTAKCAAERLRVRWSLCHGSDGPLRSPARSRLRMVRHCVRLTTPARTCSTTYQRTLRRGILGRRPPSCFSPRPMAWTTSAPRPGRSSLRYSSRPKLVPQRTEGRKTNRDKTPRCAAGLSTMTSGEGRLPRRHFNARMSVRFQPLTTPTTGRSNVHQQRPFRSGSTRLGRSQKDGLPFRWCGLQIGGSRPSTRAEEQPTGLLLCVRTYRVRSARKLLCCRNLAVSSRNVLARKSPAGLRAAGALLCRPIGGVMPDALSLPTDG